MLNADIEPLLQGEMKKQAGPRLPSTGSKRARFRIRNSPSSLTLTDRDGAATELGFPATRCQSQIACKGWLLGDLHCTTYLIHVHHGVFVRIQ